MDIGEPERSGRHRMEGGAAPWLPLGGELDHAPAPGAPRTAPPGEVPPPDTPAPHTLAPDIPAPDIPAPHRTAPGSASGPTAAPLGRPPGSASGRAPAPHGRPMDRPPTVPAQRDPFADHHEVLGLGTFNIGLVPASVTPPRTWKRAAWFAVLSSAGVLVGLVVAAIKLVGAGTPTDRLGMPGYPTTAPIVTGFGTSTSPPPPAPGRRDERPEALAAPEHTAETPRTAVSGTSPTPSSPSASPTVTTVPGNGKPVVDAVAVAARTERFYEQAVDNAATALEMVADTFEADAKALLEGHFSGVSAIEVTEISVDPARGITISTLHVRNKDGSTTTEKRQLGFTTIGDPLIDAERLFGGV